MTREEKMACYESYIADVEYEWGTTDKAMTFEEFCEDCEEYGWDMI